MRGDTVVVKDCAGKPLVRRVWNEDQGTVYIRTEEEYQKALAGGSALEPVGFPRGDVYEYDPGHLERAGRGDWSALSRRGLGGSTALRPPSGRSQNVAQP